MNRDLGPCIEWTGAKNSHGYGHRKIPKTRKNKTIHRTAWEEAYGPIPDGLWVLHKCDNPPCYNVDHLFLGTVLDNSRDMHSKGRGRKSKAPHGTTTKYNLQKCRCELCTRAVRLYGREHYRRKYATTGKWRV